MKRILVNLAALGLLVCNAPTHAADPYLGLKAGAMYPDSDRLDSAYNLGLTLGWRIPGYDYFAAEGELTTTLLDGEVSATGADWQVNTLAAYGVFRGGTANVMFKGKLGLAYWDQRFEIGADDDDIDLSVGAGIAIALGHGLLEIEYTEIESDLAFISVGYVLGFF